MILSPHPDPASFYEHARLCLEEAEAENILMIGLVWNLIRSNEKMNDSIYLATVDSSESIIAAALLVPPYGLVVTNSCDAALALIADDLLTRNLTPRRVFGAAGSAERFARLWGARTGRLATHVSHEQIYQADMVNQPPGVPGALHAATEEDVALVVPWMRDFFDDGASGPHGIDIEALVRAFIAKTWLYLWKDGVPVSMACCTGPTPNGMRINNIYTPPEYRRRGYAAATVAALSQMLLDAGKRSCFLFVDVANDAGIGSYRKVGYRPVCDFDLFTL